MATTAHPEDGMRPNIPSAAVRFPAIKSYEQVDREIIGTLKPDEFTTACAASCPSRAIVFGDAADDNWSVTQMAKDARAYHVFEELNTYTAVVYLKKVNHPSPVSAGRA